MGAVCACIVILKFKVLSISKMSEFIKESVTWVSIGEEAAGQRIDNFLIKHLKGVPKSHIYRLIRGGEVRVNSKRIAADYRLQMEDKIRIPPVRLAQKPQAAVATGRKGDERLQKAIIYQDDALLVVDKPSGMAVHGGSGISQGVIEQLRFDFPEAKFLELVHRLDRETSGVLLVAKKRSALVALHQAMRDGQVDKRYLCLVKGQWHNERQHVKFPLHKFLTQDGERRVMVRDDGQTAHTIFTLQRSWHDFSLLEAELKTGRTHQIRVHLAHLGFPIAGDDKYGDFNLNKELQKKGLRRMFLHAYQLTLAHPLTGEPLVLKAPLPEELERFMQSLGSL